MKLFDKFFINDELAYKKFNNPDISIDKLFNIIDNKNIWDLKEAKTYLNFLYKYKIQYNKNNNNKYDKKIDIYISYLKNIISNLNDFQNHLLTLVATIFLPLSFITGFFGMNFKSMGVPSRKSGILTIDNAGAKLLIVSFLIIIFISYFFYKVLKIY